MGTRLESGRRFVSAVFCGLLLGAAIVGNAQTVPPASNHPAHLPYSFGNFVWWSDGELRALLKQRIPGLGDEIATTPAATAEMRDALKALLNEKGISAEILSEEPSIFTLNAQRDPEAPEPSIRFSILNPQILLKKVVLRVEPENFASLLQDDGHWGEGKQYSAFGDWFIRSRIKEILHQKGHLDAQVQITRQPPRKDGNRYQMGIVVSVNAGPLYHVSSINVDGDPLLAGKDLSQFYGMKVGDVPPSYPLAELESKVREFYLHHGYADLETRILPVLDRSRALVSYQVSVVPGPVYHLRGLTIEKLSAEQESKARDLLGMKPGDIYMEEAITGLNYRIASEPSLKGYNFSYEPKRDKTNNVIDLSLKFFKQSDDSSVMIK
jgi:outer membrane protein insertion porin family